jgi:hypothetical protein
MGKVLTNKNNFLFEQVANKVAEIIAVGVVNDSLKVYQTNLIAFGELQSRLECHRVPSCAVGFSDFDPIGRSHLHLQLNFDVSGPTLTRESEIISARFWSDKHSGRWVQGIANIQPY